MRIVISTFGTRGDVQPYLALAVGLQSAGHRVTLATSHNFTAWIQAYGVGTHPTRFSPQDAMHAPAAQEVIQGRNFIRQVRLLRDMMRQSPEAQDEVWAAIQAADFVIQSPTGTGALEAADRLGLPAALASPVPFAPTRAFPSFFLGPVRFSLGAAYNYLTHQLTQRLLWAAMGGPLSNHLRKRLGLRPWRSFGEWQAHARRLGLPMLYGFSTHVLPMPTDWAGDQVITGYWFLEAPPGWPPEAVNGLLRFLDEGPPPVYIGFGSMSQVGPQHQARLALRALELTGRRGVLLAGGRALAGQAVPPGVFAADDVPHAWLFPRMAAVVHHGGAGTTAATLRAGVPGLIAPFAGDQPAWAERVAGLGVGQRLPGMRRLTAEKLAEVIQDATSDSGMRARAAALGQKIRAEDGVGRAVDIVERLLAGARPGNAASLRGAAKLA
jgi:UDP:flavonoid glycosyltransferase YjiC (YdhE family)